MSELAGKKASISILGGSLPMVGEECELVPGNTSFSLFRVKNETKRVLDSAESVILYGNSSIPSTSTAITGTNTTTIKINSHGLVTGDALVNNSRSKAFRTVTKVDANTLSVESVAGQTVGDEIVLLKILTNADINYIAGTISTYPHLQYYVYISASYLTKTIVATAHEYTHVQGSDMGDITPFLAEYKKRMPLNKFSYGTLSMFDVIDEYFRDALLADTPQYLLLDSGDASGSKALLAYFEKTELKAAIGSPQDSTVSFISANNEVS